MSLILDAFRRLQSGDKGGEGSEPGRPADDARNNTGISDDIWVRLEAAVSALDSEVSAAHADLASHVTHIEQRLATQAASAPQDAAPTESEEARLKIEALAQELAQRDAELGAATQGIAQLKDEVALLSAEVERLRAEAEQHAASDRTQEMESLVASERARSELLESRLREKQEEAASARELAAGLARELDARIGAWQEEARALRAEIETLRRANASLIPLAENGSDTVAFAATDAEGNRLRMGEILIRVGALTQDQLDAALAEQTGKPHRRIGTIFIENDYVGDEPVARALAGQLALPFVRLTPETIDPAAPRLIQGQIAQRRQCLPITATPDHVVLAMANPQDLIALDDVKLASGRCVSPVVAAVSDIAAALSRYYDTR